MPIIILVTFAAFVVEMAVVYLNVRPTLTRTILKRLHAEGEYQFIGRYAWNPSSKLNSRIVGRARATYVVTDDGVVHLFYEPATERPREMTGVLPRLAPSRGPVVFAVIGTYMLAAIGGYALGRRSGAGSDVDPETAGTVGAVLGLAAVWLVAHVGLIVWHIFRRPVMVSGGEAAPQQEGIARQTGSSGSPTPAQPGRPSTPYRELWAASQPRRNALGRQLRIAATAFVVSFVAFLVTPSNAASLVCFLVFLAAMFWFAVAALLLGANRRSVGRSRQGLG